MAGDSVIGRHTHTPQDVYNTINLLKAEGGLYDRDHYTA